MITFFLHIILQNESLKGLITDFTGVSGEGSTELSTGQQYVLAFFIFFYPGVHKDNYGVTDRSNRAIIVTGRLFLTDL